MIASGDEVGSVTGAGVAVPAQAESVKRRNKNEMYFFMGFLLYHPERWLSTEVSKPSEGSHIANMGILRRCAPQNDMIKFLRCRSDKSQCIQRIVVSGVDG